MGACVVVDRRHDVVHVSDNKPSSQPAPILSIDPITFDTFQAELRGDAPTGANGQIVVTHIEHTSSVRVVDIKSGDTLNFSSEEWSAFATGAAHGDFDQHRLSAVT